MKACGNGGQIDLAFNLFRLMRSRGVEATVATFGTLISIAADAQRHDCVKLAWGWLQDSGALLAVVRSSMMYHSARGLSQVMTCCICYVCFCVFLPSFRHRLTSHIRWHGYR